MLTNQWTLWQKIAFRFFFLFLSLQVLTENFLGNLFGDILFAWKLGEKVFVQPCLWLNNHFFHFKYIPQSWTTFSGSLHTIRDTIYFLFACLGCITWTIFDKKRNDYNKLHYWFSQFLITGLSCVVFFYGVIKVFPIQMSSPSVVNLYRPVGDLSPFELIWATFGYGKPYQVFSGLFEVAGAIFILFIRTRVVGLLIIISVMLNVIMLNYTYQIGVLITSFYILLMTLFLLAPYARQLIRFFFTKQPTVLFSNKYTPSTKWFRLILFLLIGTSFFVSTRNAYNRYARAEHVNQSRQYYLVKKHIIDNDTLKFIENDPGCWRLWSERIVDGKGYVTIATMKPGATKTYQLDRDTLKHILILHPSNQPDTTSLNFTYSDIDNSNWELQGIIREKNVRMELQHIRPDTTLNLLKTRRTIIIFDDESDNQ
ncbi:MAG: hypothetical protein ABIR18_08170 [Chitinophagaceae bacterium]